VNKPGHCAVAAANQKEPVVSEVYTWPPLRSCIGRVTGEICGDGCAM
jgi:hypothetical protein